MALNGRINLNIVLLALLGWLAVMPVSVFSQITSIETSFVSQTATSSSTVSTSSVDPITMSVECWIPNGSSSLPVATSRATLSGVSCYQVYSQSGELVSIPVTAAPDFRPISMKTSSSASATATPTADSSESSSSSSHNLLRILLPALLGSLIGILLLVFATIYFIRSKTRRETQDSQIWRSCLTY
ncbi:hypothetical protein PNOK_0833600 [Pyrrhoderma noxium]|uniref:Uncharacterized protein n=1 Tax=Pyrrhoderma noxium TaxID=2282107 RepID=A0A286UAZ3_9AGAM|nr:hypothetical protein PNOK_0833600 [Pyrrhoderma noxium]